MEPNKSENNIKTKKTSPKSGVPDREGNAGRLRFRPVLLNQVGEIKLKYNIFTNIMTRMLSNVKIYSL